MYQSRVLLASVVAADDDATAAAILAALRRGKYIGREPEEGLSLEEFRNLPAGQPMQISEARE